MMHEAYLSVGSNLGRRIENCRLGISGVGETEGCRLIGQSRFYRTEPVDFTDQQWFINAALHIRTGLKPLDLLARLQDIQRHAGRLHDRVRFGPRVLDLDILLYDDLVMETETLCLPHPRMHLRRFVLVPVCDMNPEVIHPVLRVDARTLLERLSSDGQKVVPYQ